MRIYLDNIIFSLQKAGGISVVWENLMKSVLNRDDVRFIEYQDADQNIHRAERFIDEGLIIKRHARSFLLEQFLSPRINETSEFIFHSSFYRLCDNPNAINITTVHDFIYDLAPVRKSLSNRIRNYLTHRTIAKSDHIVCISENTKRDLLKILPETKDNQIYVIHNGVSEEYSVIDSPEPSYSRHLLFVGGRNGYKNFGYAVEMAAQNKLKLLICGNQLTDRERELLSNQLGKDNYEIRVRPSNQELNILYNSVFALIYPSSYEGFGIPILEAQRAGCPVIALNASSIPEVIGDTPLLLQSLDASSFRNAFDILNQPNIREDIIKEGLENSKRFSWKKMASEYQNLYDSLLK